MKNLLKYLGRIAFWNGFFAILFVGVVFQRCASIGSPQGGNKDSLAPVITSITPEMGALNFNSKKVVITFNEYIALKDQQKFFLISPPHKKKPTLSIRQKSLVITFEEDLDSATTYRLDFGNAIVDNNEGNALKDFSYIFSTGSEIDSLMMVSQVVNARTCDTVIGGLMFYFDSVKANHYVRYDSTNGELQSDSTIFNSRANALFRSDSSGYVVADILKGIPYRVFALADENSNMQYEAGTDLIAFSSKMMNPLELPEFTLYYDKKTNHLKIDNAQLKLRVFKEEPIHPQIFLGSKRASQLKMELYFSMPNTIIDTLDFKGVDPKWLIKDWNKTQDTLSVWIATPTEQDIETLSDSIQLHLVYQKQDSAWQYVSEAKDLSFIYKRSTEDKAKKEREARLAQEKEKQRLKAEAKAAKKALKAEKKRQRLIRRGKLPAMDSLAMDSMKNKPPVDSTAMQKPEEPPVNPFKFKVDASQVQNPLRPITFTLDYPISSIDKEQIKLVEITEKRGSKDGEKVETAVPFTLETPTLTTAVLTAKWKEGTEYTLLIPSGVLRNIAHQANDTLQSKFTTMERSKFGTFIFKVQTADSTDKADYIFELVSGLGKNERIVNTIKGIRPGDVVTMNYIEKGEYRLRIIQDNNRNQQWDTGNILLRTQPEMVVIWSQSKEKGVGKNTISARENWELEFDVKLDEFFDSQTNY